VFIDDPVNRTSFVLDPGSKSADKMLRLSTITEDHNAEDDEQSDGQVNQGKETFVKTVRPRSQAGRRPW